MIDLNMKSKRKHRRIKISNIKDLKKALLEEGYISEIIHEDNLEKSIVKLFNISDIEIKRLLTYMNENISFKVNDISDFIQYIKDIIIFEEEHNLLFEKIKNINELRIDREEYDRIVTEEENVEEELKAIEKIKHKVSKAINDDEYSYLEILEKELDENYIYAKDIELLKKIIMFGNTSIKEKYNNENNTKSLYIKIPNEMHYDYIPAILGSVEYHQHIKSNIPRINRLIRNIDKYIEVYNEESGIYKLNHSNALQDSINLAIVKFNEKEFKAISGKNNIKGYCCAPEIKKAVFKSCKVNKLGRLGVGYRRVNDSEKKIFEEIDRRIRLEELQDSGELIVYSKWQPCPSCYYVISQFCEKYPRINVCVKYRNIYGES